MQTPLLNRILIIDGSYLIHRALKVPELWELTNPKTGQRTGGIFGFLRSLNYEFRKYNYYPVVTWDSGLAKRRTDVYPMYKNNHLRLVDGILRRADSEESAISEVEKALRADSPELAKAIDSIRESMKVQKLQDFQTHQPDDYRVQYARQRDVLINILDALGIPSIKLYGWEGDDLMVILQRISKESLVMTDDKDLIQLLDSNTEVVRPMQKQHLKIDTYLSDNGMDDIREMVIIKAITGDSSDSIPGVTDGLERKFSLGATRAKTVAKLVLKHNFDEKLYLEELYAMDKNYYNGFVVNHGKFIRNMKLVDLSLVETDESVVNHIMGEVTNKAGKTNFLQAAMLIGEQGINNFDINEFTAKANLLSTQIVYKG